MTAELLTSPATAQPPLCWDLDASTVRFDETGVKDFQSPYSTEQLNAVAGEFEDAVWSAGGLGLDSAALMVARMLVGYWSACALRLAQAAMIDCRARRRGAVPAGSDRHFGFLGQYWRREKLADEPLLTALVAGPPQPAAWRSPLLGARSYLTAEPVKRLPAFLFSPRDDMLVLSNTPAVQKWCGSQGRRAIYWEPSWHFGSLDPAKLRAGAWEEVAGGLAEVLQDALARHGVEIAREGAAWFSRQLATSAAAAEEHLRRASFSRSRMPDLFIGANAGSPWTRLMRVLVRRAGGRVLGFEHGCGLGVTTDRLPARHELFGCSEFICYSAASARLIEAQDPAAGLDAGDVPALTVLEEPASTSGPAARDQGRRLLFAPFGTAGDRARAGVIPPDLTAVDFNARCVGFFRAMGFDVVLKPHPSNAGPGKAAYEAALDVACSEAPFEDVLPACDMVCTCDPTSTTIKAALDSRKPVVIVDLGIPRLSDGARAMIEQRACIIPASFDSAERIQVDWAAMRQGFATASERAAGAGQLWY